MKVANQPRRSLINQALLVCLPTAASNGTDLLLRAHCSYPLFLFTVLIHSTVLIHCSYSLHCFYPLLLFTVLIHCFYPLLLFTVLIHCSYPLFLSTVLIYCSYPLHCFYPL